MAAPRRQNPNETLDEIARKAAESDVKLDRLRAALQDLDAKREQDIADLRIRLAAIDEKVTTRGT